MIKTLSKLEIEGNFHNLLKGRYKKLATSILPNGKRLNVFPLRAATRRGCLLSPPLVDIVLEVLAIRQEENIKPSGLEKEIYSQMS